MTIDFSTWSELEPEEVAGHRLIVLTAVDNVLDVAPEILVDAVRDHYVSSDRLANILERLGKPAAATYIRERLPTTKTARSADLGEILAAEYIGAETGYLLPIKRLRWKDHRNMAMRGDDVIGIRPASDDQPIGFLKTEAKSCAALNTATVTKARDALNSHEGLPSPHALSFVADRLHETGNDELGDLIDVALLNDGISPEQVEHLLFTFSSNSPRNFLSTDLSGYRGAMPQVSVGLRVADHQQLIAVVFELIETDDDS